jgi:hypothetical protein
LLIYYILVDRQRNLSPVHGVVREVCLGVSVVAFLAVIWTTLVYNQVKETHRDQLQVPATPLILKVLKIQIRAIMILLIMNWRDKTHLNLYIIISIPDMSISNQKSLRRY